MRVTTEEARMPRHKKNELTHVEINVKVDGRKLGKVFVDRNGIHWKAGGKRDWLKRSWQEFDRWISA
jgi:hypothetical protein